MLAPFLKHVFLLDYTGEDEAFQNARSAFLNLFSQGVSRIFFIGHASPTALTDELLFDLNRDVSRITSGPISPIMSMLTSNTSIFIEDTLTNKNDWKYRHVTLEELQSQSSVITKPSFFRHGNNPTTGIKIIFSSENGSGNLNFSIDGKRR